jgi:hypothetical protein
MTPDYDKSIEARLEARIERIPFSTCWWWMGTLSDGYGRFDIGRRTKLAHRVAYETWVGPIPPGLTLDPLCRNRGCIRPTHLEAVTTRENVLRGVGHAARAARATHCPSGHPYEGDNLVLEKRGRRCRTCRNAQCKARRERREARV